MAYWKMEPFPGERADLGFAMLASVIANVNRDPKKKGSSFEIEDFLIHYDEEERRPSQEQLLEKLRSVGFFRGEDVNGDTG